MIGGVSNNNGLFAEEYFYNSLDKGEKILLGEKFDKLIKSKIIEDEDNRANSTHFFFAFPTKSLPLQPIF